MAGKKNEAESTVTPAEDELKELLAKELAAAKAEQEKALADMRQEMQEVLARAEQEKQEAIAKAKEERQMQVAAIGERQGVNPEDPKAQERREYLEELVPITLFKDEDKYKDDVIVGVNGKIWQIQRGKEVMVPRYIKQILDNSRRQDQVATERLEEIVENARRAEETNQ